MIRINSVLCALLLSVGAVGAAGANDKPVLFVDHGVLTSVSEHGVFKMDTATGDMYVSTPDADADRSLFFSGDRKLTQAFEPNSLVFLSAKGVGAQKMVGDCAFKQQVLEAATRLVVIGCGAGGNQYICGQARNAAAEAWREFQYCANNLPEPG